MSKGGRSYSDPSYGSKKVFAFTRVTVGTRATALVESISVMHPVTITDWNAIADVAGSGAATSWVLKKNTTTLATISFATNATAATVVEGSLTETSLTAGDTLNLFSVLGTSDPNQTILVNVEYRETFEVGDN